MTTLSSENAGFGYVCSCALQTLPPKKAQLLIQKFLKMFQGEGSVSGAYLKEFCTLDPRFLSYLSKSLNIDIATAKNRVLNKRLKTISPKAFCSRILIVASKIQCATFKNSASQETTTLSTSNVDTSQIHDVLTSVTAQLTTIEKQLTSTSADNSIESNIEAVAECVQQNIANTLASHFESLQTELTTTKAELVEQHQEIGEFLQESIAEPVAFIHQMVIEAEDTNETTTADENITNIAEDIDEDFKELPEEVELEEETDFLDDETDLDLNSGLNPIAHPEITATELKPLEENEPAIETTTDNIVEDVEVDFVEEHDGHNIVELQENQYQVQEDSIATKL